MSITAAGVRLGLFGPPPVAPTRGLLKTKGVVVEDGEGRWMNGVNLVGYPPPEGVTQWNPCAEEGTFDPEKIPGDAPPFVTFDPVAIYLEVECTSTQALAGLKERAAVSLEAGTSKAVESLLVAGNSSGVGGNANPYLGDGNVDLIAGTYSPRVGMALLEDFIATHYGARGMIHASPGAADMLPSILETDDVGTLYTQGGTPVIPGQGYAGAEANGSAPGAHQQYLFASSPVEVRLTDITVTDLVSSLDRSDNSLRFIAERWALVTWDTELQAAVLVDYTTS